MILQNPDESKRQRTPLVAGHVAKADPAGHSRTETLNGMTGQVASEGHSNGTAGGDSAIEQQLADAQREIEWLKRQLKDQASGCTVDTQALEPPPGTAMMKEAGECKVECPHCLVMLPINREQIQRMHKCASCTKPRDAPAAGSDFRSALSEVCCLLALHHSIVADTESPSPSRMARQSACFTA